MKKKKYWSFSFSISLSNEYSGLISFKIEWFDLAVQGTLKSLLTPLVNPIQRDLHSTVCHIHVHHPLLASLCFFQPVLFIHFVCLPWIYYPYPDRSSGFTFPTSLASLCSWCVSPIFSFPYSAESVFPVFTILVNLVVGPFQEAFRFLAFLTLNSFTVPNTLWCKTISSFPSLLPKGM